MSQLAQISPHWGAGPSLKLESHVSYSPTVARRKKKFPRYRTGTYKLERRARPEQVATWIVDRVKRDGGTATFVGFGRWARRLFSKAVRLLPDEYDTRLLLPRTISGQPDHVTHQQTRNEYRLRVHDTTTPTVSLIPTTAPAKGSKTRGPTIID